MGEATQKLDLYPPVKHNNYMREENVTHKMSLLTSNVK